MAFLLTPWNVISMQEMYRRRWVAALSMGSGRNRMRSLPKTRKRRGLARGAVDLAGVAAGAKGNGSRLEIRRRTALVFPRDFHAAEMAADRFAKTTNQFS